MFIYSDMNKNYLYKLIQIAPNELIVISHRESLVSKYSMTIEIYLKQRDFIHELTLAKLIEFYNYKPYELNKTYYNNTHNYILDFLKSLVEEKEITWNFNQPIQPP